MSSTLLFPLFLLRLVWVITPTIVKLGWIKTSRFRPLLLAIVLLLLTSVISITTSLNPSPTTPPLNPLVLTQQAFEALSISQPTHRDVLLNLSKIYDALGNTEKAQYYRDEAKKLDPNSPLFSSEK